MIVHIALIAAGLGVPQQEQDLERALDRFRQSTFEEQTAVVDAIDAAVEASDDKSVKELLKLRDRARRELTVKPHKPLEFYTHTEYAPVQAARSFMPETEYEWQRQQELMRPWESNPSYYVQTVRYSYADDVAYETEHVPTPEDRLQDFFLGFVPGNDVLAAWLESKFDHDDKLDKIAGHFEHAYCDRVGNCFSGITIYDAYASQMSIEMSDIDVIAYARNIQKDKSLVSPIPANSKRQRMYDASKEDFLRLYKHRTLCEAAARIYLYPQSWLRSDHEGLRKRLWYIFADEDDDPEKVRRRLVKHKTRDELVDATEKLFEKDNDKAVVKQNEWAATRAESRWAVAKIAYSVLRDHGMLTGRR